MIKTIAFLSSDGGCAKTTSAHLLCLGATWHNVKSAFLHSDDKQPINVNRPYNYFDCRDAKILVSKINKISNSGVDGIVVIDGGAGRKGNDEWFSKNANLIIIPVDLSSSGVSEAINTSMLVKQNGGKFVFIIPACPSDKVMGKKDRGFIDNISQYGDIAASIPLIKNIRDLNESDEDGKFVTPPTAVNKAAKDLYSKLSLYW
jgi:MinD-like ATPase involved in chromosome partitioning or flagellar assembly